MQLIDEGFRAWWKKYSAIALLAIALVNTAAVGAWEASPGFQEFVKSTPWAVYAGVIANAVVGTLGFIGRFIKQATVIIDAGGSTNT